MKSATLRCEKCNENVTLLGTALLDENPTCPACESPLTPGRLMEKAQQIGSLVEKKNKAYGDSVAVSPRILAELYPNGVPVEKFSNMLLTVRILDKLQRIAHDQTAFNEDPWQDIAGYGILGAVMSEEK